MTTPFETENCAADRSSIHSCFPIVSPDGTWDHNYQPSLSTPYVTLFVQHFWKVFHHHISTAWNLDLKNTVICNPKECTSFENNPNPLLLEDAWNNMGSKYYFNLLDPRTTSESKLSLKNVGKETVRITWWHEATIILEINSFIVWILNHDLYYRLSLSLSSSPLSPSDKFVMHAYRFPIIKLTTKYPYSIILACGRKREAPRFVLHYGNCQ